MKRNIKDFGDPIEKYAYTLMDDSLRLAYNAFWGTFIGNIDGKPESISNISFDNNKLRLLLGQYTYTVLQNYVFLFTDKKPFGRIRFIESRKVSLAIHRYIDIVHNFYNTLEVVEKYNDLDTPDKISLNQHKGFRSFRNHVAHNVRPHLMFKNDRLYFINKFSWFDDKSATLEYLWTESEVFRHFEFVEADVFLEQIRESTKHLLYEILAKSQNCLNSLIPERDRLDRDVEVGTFIPYSPPSGSILK